MTERGVELGPAWGASSVGPWVKVWAQLVFSLFFPYSFSDFIFSFSFPFEFLFLSFQTQT